MKRVRSSRTRSVSPASTSVRSTAVNTPSMAQKTCSSVMKVRVRAAPLP